MVVRAAKGAIAILRRRPMAGLALVAFAIALVGCGHRQPSVSEPPQQTCPVMGVPAKPSFFVDYQGKRVFFCCNDCARTFLAEAQKFMAEMRRTGVHLMPTPPAPTPPTLKSDQPCACVPGSKRPHLNPGTQQSSFRPPQTMPLSEWRRTATPCAEQARVKQVSPDRAPPPLFDDFV